MRVKILLLLLLWAGSAWGQEKIGNESGLDITLNEAKTDSKTLPPKAEDQKLEDLIRKVIADNKNSKVPIGEIVLKTRTIIYDDEFAQKQGKQSGISVSEVNNMLHKIYLKLLEKERFQNKKYESLTIKVENGKAEDQYISPILRIDSVKFDIQEGMLEFIKVYLNDGSTFTNKKAPIALVHLEQRGNDRLYNSDGDKFVLLKTVVAFEVNKRFGYLPDNKTLTLVNADDNNPGKLTLHKNSDINSLVNLTAYSDLLGLLGDEPNALVNFEANAKFYLHRKNFYNSFLYIFPSIQPHFHYNRIDKKFDSIIISDNNLNATEVFRRHNFAVGFDLWIFKCDWRPANSFELKAGYLFTSSKVYINEQKTNAINHIKFLEANLKSKVIDNFGIDLNVKYMWQKLNENEHFSYANERMLPLRGGIYYTSPQAKGDDKIFLRFTNYLVLDNRKKDFSQIQIGFTKSLNL